MTTFIIIIAIIIILYFASRKKGSTTQFNSPQIDKGPLEQNIELLKRVLEKLSIKGSDQEEHLKQQLNVPSPTYIKNGTPNSLFYQFKDCSKEDLLRDLKTELDLPYRCWDDPEARAWARAFESMVKAGGNSFSYRWGAHKMVVEIHRFDLDRYLLIRTEYLDYYV